MSGTLHTDDLAAAAEANRLDALAGFHPRRWLRNGHLQTIAGNFLPREHGELPAAQAQLIQVAPSGASAENARRDGLMTTQVLCHCHWQPQEVRAERPTVIIVHGLEGSSDSQYVRGNAAKMWTAGCNVVRMNMRNCGGTERLTPTLYHSGLSGDVLAVMESVIAQYGLQQVALVGYSMGGNLVLKLAGELGAEAPLQLRAVVGVSPAVDLGPSADSLHEVANRVYEWKFLRALVQRYHRKVALFPRTYDPARAEGLRSVRDFDERVTSLYAGFASADDYYYRAASARVVDRIAVPTLILHALDDPFIRLTAETREKIAANDHVTFVETAHGGHCAFLATPDAANGYDGYWAEHTLLRFIQQACG